MLVSRVTTRRISPLLHARRLNNVGPHLAPLTFLPSRAMSAHHGESSIRPEPDRVLQDIADYVHNYKITSDLAFETARLCLIDTIGCGLEGLRFPDCARLLGPVVEGTVVPNGIETLVTCPGVTVESLLQEREFRARTTSSIRSSVPSTLAPSSDGSISMTVSWLPNVCACG